MAQIGPPDFSKKGPPDFSKKNEKKTEAPEANSRLEKHEDGSTSIDITEAVQAGKKIFSALGKGAAKAVESGSNAGAVAAAAVKEKMEAAKRKQQESAAQKATAAPPSFNDEISTKPLPVAKVKPPRVDRKIPWGVIGLVAVVAAAIGVGSYFLFHDKTEDATVPAVVEQTQQEPAPAIETVDPIPALDPGLMPAIPSQGAIEEPMSPLEQTSQPTPAVPKVEEKTPPSPVQTIPEPAPNPVVEAPRPRPAPVVERPKPAAQPVQKPKDDIEEMNDAVDDFFKNRQG